jgi:hypothetical protein
VSDAAEELFVLAGVPLGAPRPAPTALPDSAELRQAFRSLTRQAAPEELLPHTAWLSAFHHHWPARFRAVFGAEGQELVAGLRAAVIDENRYLKLRRIAVENLSRML